MKALELALVSAISSPPLPFDRNLTLALPPESTSTRPLPTTTAPPLTTAPLSISTRLPVPLAISVPESASAPLTMMVPLLKVSTSAPVLIVAPLKVSAAPLKTFTVMPASILLTAKAAPEPTSSVAPDNGFMFDPPLVPLANSKVPPLAMNSELPLPSLVTWPPDSRMPRPPAEDGAAAGNAARQDHQGDPLADLGVGEEGAGAEFAGGAAEQLQPVVAGVGADELDGAAARHRGRTGEHAAGLRERPARRP